MRIKAKTFDRVMTGAHKLLAVFLVPMMAFAFLLAGANVYDAVAGTPAKDGTGGKFILGPFVTTIDGASTYTTAIPATLVWMSKNGGTPGTKNQAGDSSHVGQGFHVFSFNSSDISDVGRMKVWVELRGKFQVWDEFDVWNDQAFDSMFGTDQLKVDIFHVQGTAPKTSAAGIVQAGVKYWGDTAIPATHTAGYPIVTIKDGTGIGEIDTSSGHVVKVLTVNTATKVLTSNTATVEGTDATTYFESRTLAAADYFLYGSDDVAVVTLVNTLTTYTNNTVQSGDGYARMGAAGVGLTAVALADATSDAVIAHAVFGADATTYQTQGTFGQAIGDPGADASTLWGLCNTNLDTTVSSRGTSTLTQTQVTGGAYALDTDGSGRIRIVDGTAAGEIDTSSGLVQLLAATQASIDAIELDTGTTLPAAITAAQVAPPNLLLSTTVATATSQTVLILTAGSDDDDAYNGCTVVIYDGNNNSYPTIRRIKDYDGATTTATLNVAGAFTVAGTDVVKVFAFREGSMGGP